MTKRIGWLAILTAPLFGQTPVIQGVVNTASLSSTLSPGLLATVRGTGFASAEFSCLTGGGAPFQCAGVTVYISGRPAPIIQVQPAQVLIQVPYEAIPGPTTLAVERAVDGQTLRAVPFNIVLDTFAPALMTANGTGSGDGAFFSTQGTAITAASPAEPEGIVTAAAAGLGATRPPANSGMLPQSPLPTVIPPKVMVGSLEATVTSSVLAPGLVGVYQVSFVVPKGTPPGPQLVWLEYGARRSNVVTLPVSDPRRPLAAVAVNAASGDAGIAGLAWITLFGDRLAERTREWAPSDFEGGRLPLALEGVSVTVNGKPAAIGFVSPAQVNLLSPADPAEGPVLVEIANGHGTSSVTVKQQKYSPGFFAYKLDNRSYTSAVRADATLITRSNPAAPGETVLLFGTGFGAVAPGPPQGENFQGAYPLAEPSLLAVRIGGIRAQVDFAGLISPGLYQFNVKVPDLWDGDHQVEAEIGGYRSLGERLLSVRR